MEKQRGISITTSVMQFPYHDCLVNLLDTPGHEDFSIGCGKLFKGVYHLYKDETYLYQTGKGHTIQEVRIVKGLNNPDLDAAVGEDLAQQLRDELELVQGASNEFDEELFLAGEITPVFFGTALGNFGVDQLRQVRTGKDVVISDALTFMAGDRSHVEEAYPGDILGLHNHGTIQIGDTFTQGEMMKFTGIPNFAPELFRRIRLKDPLKQKQLLKGLVQLSEEGAVQVFRPISNNDLIVGAVGVLQFDVVVARLKSEYNVEAIYESVNVATARWVESADAKKFEEFKRKAASAAPSYFPCLFNRLRNVLKSRVFSPICLFFIRTDKRF